MVLVVCVLYNIIMKNKYILIILAVFIATTILFLSKDTDKAILKPDNNLGLDLPFELSTEQINKSLTTNQPIVIESVESDWPEVINDSLLKSGYKLLLLQNATDGGSKFYNYFKSKDTVGIKFSYKWDMFKGKYQSLAINFIPLNKINSWLIEIEDIKSLVEN